MHDNKMANEQQKERAVMAEMIDLFKDLPCLWDLSSESYKDRTQKKNAWQILASKLKEIDPDANEASAKKKMDLLKSSYQREVKKIKDTKHRTGSAASDVDKPNLWYFDLMKFLDKKNEVKRTGVDSFMSEDEDEQTINITKRKKESRESVLDAKKQKLIDTAQDLLKEGVKETNSFGIYVGEKLDQISPGQREIAEKLISDVLFLAKTKNLDFDSRIETPSKSRYNAPYSHSPQYNPTPYFAQSPLSTQTSQSPNFSSDSSSSRPYTPQTYGRRFVYASQVNLPASSPTLHSPDHIQSPPTATQTQDNFPIIHIQSPPSATQTQDNFPIIHIQSPPSATQTQDNYPIIHIQSPPSASQTQDNYSNFHIQSPPSTLTQDQSPITDYSQMTQPATSQTQNVVIEGPAGDVLKELLIFGNKK